MDRVMGWQGADPIFFVGPNPSGAGHFPSRADRGFYKQLHTQGLHNAHLTDLMKVRATATEVPEIFKDSAVVHLCRGYFQEELDILDPRLVVALGEQVHRLLTDWFPGAEFELIRIPHYSYAYRYAKQARFARAMADVHSRLSSI